ncbi:MAG: MBL fold metallo-hydrolase [Lachnospiraceae bacterium]|nr:MBL fold metallo-hydrolase [Lachnospiraceae bacterium]
MREIFELVMSMYDTYNGTGMHMALFFACIIYLVGFSMQKKKTEESAAEADKRFLFIGYTLLFFIICFFPLTAKVIMKLLGNGGNVYWRMFWLLPTAIVTAYTAVQILMQMETKVKRYALLALMLVVIAMTGTFVYNDAIFDPKQNNYKLPNDTIQICDIIEADAKANGVESKKLIVPNELLTTIRQYDATILMPYGNEVVKGNKAQNDNSANIYRLMNTEPKNWEAICWYAGIEGCNYIAYPIDDAVTAALEGLGYAKIGNNEKYNVFRRNDGDTQYENQWLITQYGGADGAQLSFYTLQDNKGHLIVVDGGWESDASYVRKVLKGLGNHVDAWVITHPHRDHAGAFCKIYKKPGKLSIDKVYAVDMASPELCLENAPWDETEVYEKWLKLEIPQLTYVHAGDIFAVAGLGFEIFSAYDDYVDELSNDLLNDGSMLFKVTAEEESMLFCADVGKKMSDYLLDTYGDALKAEYIQMGHHGNGGLKKDFYDFIDAKVAFFDAPDWLMNDTTGAYSTPDNRYFMTTNGAAVYSFSTTPNQIILK